MFSSDDTPIAFGPPMARARGVAGRPGRPSTRATPCDRCPECRPGRRSILGHTNYRGSAARFPHVQGGFAPRIVVPVDQIRRLPAELPPDRAIPAEPLSAALHAVSRAGDVTGISVLVTGAGPIGALVVAALRHAGASPHRGR